MHARVSRRGPLRAGEIAEAVVLADLALVLCIASQILPFGGVLLVIAVVPMAAISARNRLRAVLAGTVAAATVGFLVLGTPVVTSVAACGALGAVVGSSARRGFGMARTVGSAMLWLWPLVAVGADLLLWVLSQYRELALAQVHNAWSGVGRSLRNAHLPAVADRGDQIVGDLLRDWWLTIPVALFFAVLVATVLAQRITQPTLRRLRATFVVTDDPGATGPISTLGVAVQPCRSCRRRSRYRCARSATAIRAPTPTCCTTCRSTSHAVRWSRSSDRTGRASRRWRASSPEDGRPPARSCDRDRPASACPVVRRSCSNDRSCRCSGFASATTSCGAFRRRPRSTSTRCSSASASRRSATARRRRCRAASSSGSRSRPRLARHPQLLISDESTAMVDSSGRARLLALLRSLVTDDGMAVVHVTHQAAEAAVADRTIALDAGRVVAQPVPIVVRPEPVVAASKAA